MAIDIISSDNGSLNSIELYKLVSTITNLLKIDHNISSAAQLIIDNHLTLEQLVKTTGRLKISDLLELTNYLLKNKN